MTASDAGSEAKRWNRRYSERHHRHGQDPSPFLVECLHHIDSATGNGNGDDSGNGRKAAQPPRALDLAMGEGRNAQHLAAAGYSVFGVDVSIVAGIRAARSARQIGLRLGVVTAAVENWCFDRIEDGVFDLITQFYFLDRELLRVVADTLRPGGHFILETFSTRHAAVSTFGPRNQAFLLDPQEANKALSDLELILFEDEVVELDEGRHQGPAGLLRVLARKPAKARALITSVSRQRPGDNAR